MMWKLIFNTGGVANKVLGLTENPILWLADNRYSQAAIIAADVWKTAPFIGLLTLAGLLAYGVSGLGPVMDMHVYNAQQMANLGGPTRLYSQIARAGDVLVPVLSANNVLNVT